VLTTQYLDEADQLADRITVVDHGRAVADGSPDELKAHSAATASTWWCATRATSPRRRSCSSALAGTAASVDADAGGRAFPPRTRWRVLADVVRALADEGIVAEDLVLRRPTLDEVFLQLTEGVPA
jgi:ABC-2 type transport system ATP-binding protein